MGDESMCGLECQTGGFSYWPWTCMMFFVFFLGSGWGLGSADVSEKIRPFPL